MLSGGLPENLGGHEWGEVEGVGWLSVPWGDGGKRERGGNKEGGGGQLHSAHPFGTVLPCKKSSALGRGVDVDYKGGVSCRRVDVRVCGGGGERGVIR